ncbi:DASH complex subunit Dad3-domain-containing protein [Armillaria fumosa]|nr:DASH complex subunit Dad3-domain-containing protein [Armillaria fumosa]
MSVTPPPAPSSTSDPIFLNNPYTGHPGLTTLEADVLWEYAKLAANVKQVASKAKGLSKEPDEQLLARLRDLEKKMGLVLTLFKASIWGVINEQQ